MSIRVSESQLKSLKIKSGGGEWYNAKGEVRKNDVVKLVNNIIPIWKKLGLNNDEIAIGLSVINVESGYNIYASNRFRTYDFFIELVNEYIKLINMKKNINEKLKEFKDTFKLSILGNAKTKNNSENLLNELQGISKETSNSKIEELISKETFKSEDSKDSRINDLKEKYKDLRNILTDSIDKRIKLGETILNKTSAIGLGQFIYSTWDEQKLSFNKTYKNDKDLSMIEEEAFFKNYDYMELEELEDHLKVLQQAQQDKKEEEEFFKNNKRFDEESQIKVMGYWVKNNLVSNAKDYLEDNLVDKLYDGKTSVEKIDLAYAVHHSGKSKSKVKEYLTKDPKTSKANDTYKTNKGIIRGTYEFWKELLCGKKAVYKFESLDKYLVDFDKIELSEEDYKMVDKDLKKLSMPIVEPYQFKKSEEQEFFEKRKKEFDDKKAKIKEEEVIVFEQGKESLNCKTKKKVGDLKEGDLIYLNETDQLKKILKEQFSAEEDPTQEEIVTYFIERVGRELDNDTSDILKKMLENFNELKEGKYSCLSIQSKFDLLREGTDNLKFDDLLKYMLSFVSDEISSLKVMNTVFEGIEKDQLSTLEIGSLTEKPEEDFYSKLLKEYEGKKLRSTYDTKNKQVRMVLDFLLIEYITKRLDCKIDRVMKYHLLKYHEENELTLHGKGMYEKLKDLSKNNNKINIFQFLYLYKDDKRLLKKHLDYCNQGLKSIIDIENLKQDETEDKIEDYLRDNYIHDFEKFENIQIIEEIIQLSSKESELKLAKAFFESFLIAPVACRYNKESGLFKNRTVFEGFEKGKTSGEAKEIKKTENTPAENDLVYLTPNEKVYSQLATEMMPNSSANEGEKLDTNDATEEEVVNYFTERTGRSINSELEKQEFFKGILINFNKLKEGNYSYLLKQTNFDKLRNCSEEISFKELVGYILSIANEEQTPLELLNNSFKENTFNELHDNIDIGDVESDCVREEELFQTVQKILKDNFEVLEKDANKQANMVLKMIYLKYIEKELNTRIDRLVIHIMVFKNKMMESFLNRGDN